MVFNLTLSHINCQQSKHVYHSKHTNTFLTMSTSKPTSQKHITGGVNIYLYGRQSTGP